MGINPNDPIQSIMGTAKYLSYLRGQGVPNSLPELTKAYILGPTGYKQLANGGSPTGANQIPGAMNFLNKIGETGASATLTSPNAPPSSPHPDINIPSPVNPTMPTSANASMHSSIPGDLSLAGQMAGQMAQFQDNSQMPEAFDIDDTLAHQIYHNLGGPR
jgi:hypothetical protein